MKTTKTTLSNTATFIVLVVFMFSGFTMFAQSPATPDAAASKNTMTVTVATSSETTTLSMVSWFMGTKQTINSNTTDAASSSRKQLINSGIAPNRLLIKAFLKKASNYATSVA